MPRTVEHSEKVKGKVCTCGAHFKTPAELRRHVRDKSAQQMAASRRR